MDPNNSSTQLLTFKVTSTSQTVNQFWVAVFHWAFRLFCCHPQIRFLHCYLRCDKTRIPSSFIYSMYLKHSWGANWMYKWQSHDNVTESLSINAIQQCHFINVSIISTISKKSIANTDARLIPERIYSHKEYMILFITFYHCIISKRSG